MPAEWEPSGCFLLTPVAGNTWGFSKFLKDRKEPVGWLVLPEKQGVNMYVGMRVLSALKLPKMDQRSLLPVQVL